MSIRVPSQPSSFLSQAMLQLSTLAHGVGAHFMDDCVRSYLCLFFSELVAKEFQLLVESGKQIGRAACIQLMFDISFLEAFFSMCDFGDDCLLGALQLFETTNKMCRSALTRKKALNALQRLVEGKLDPIDVAYYRPLIVHQVDKYCSRVTLLFDLF